MFLDWLFPFPLSPFGSQIFSNSGFFISPPPDRGEAMALLNLFSPSLPKNITGQAPPLPPQRAVVSGTGRFPPPPKKKTTLLGKGFPPLFLVDTPMVANQASRHSLSLSWPIARPPGCSPATTSYFLGWKTRGSQFFSFRMETSRSPPSLHTS